MSLTAPCAAHAYLWLLLNCWVVFAHSKSTSASLRLLLRRRTGGTQTLCSADGALGGFFFGYFLPQIGSGSVASVRSVWISLGDIQNLPTLWVLALFGSFCNFCFRVQTCRHLGGGMCILFEICKKTPFQKCMGLGGRGCDFSAQHNTWGGAHKHSTAPFIHFYSESLSLSALLFSGRAGTPLGQTSPCLWTGTYFFNFCQSCNLRAFTGTQPSLRGSVWTGGIAKSVVRLGQ